MMSLKWQEGRQPRGLLCFSAAFFVMALTVTLLFVRGLSLADVGLLSALAACLYALITVCVLREQFSLFGSLFLGLFIGWLWCCGYLLAVWQPAQQWDLEKGDVRIELDSYAEGYVSYGVVYGRITHIDGVECGHKAKIYLKDGSPEFAPGDVLVFQGLIRAAERDLERNMLQQGYYLTVTQKGTAQVLPGDAMNLLRRATVLSRRIAQCAQELLPGDEGALLSALLSGQKDGFSEKFDRALSNSGTRHITAVSGLHVTTLAGILLWVCGKRWGLLVSVPVALVYAAVTGFSPSVVRAVILLMFWASSFWLKQEKDSLTALAAALFVLMAWNPFSCVSAGLLLSFAATRGLILLSAPLYEVFGTPLKRVKNRCAGKILHYLLATTVASLAATVFTTPLNILYFDTVPLLGIVANLLILWALSTILVLGILVLFAACIWMPAAQFLASWVLYWPLTWVVRCIRFIGSWRFAATDSANLMLAAACLAALVAVLLWRGSILSGKTLLQSCAVMLCAVTLFTVVDRSLFGLLEVYNYGNQPVFLIRNAGISMINTGAQFDRAADAVGRAMDRWNADRLDTVLCTTDDYRTQSGLRAVTETAEIRRILLPSADGTVANIDDADNVRVYRDSGTVIVSNLTAELIRGGDEAYALRLLGKRFSLVSLCGLKAEEALTLTAEYPLAAGILVVTDSLANDWKVFYELCQRIKPEQILVITGGYSEHGDRFFGIPLTHVHHDTERFRFMR